MSDAPQGYKQTDVGVIPEEWEATTISQVFQFKQGVQMPVEQQAYAEREGYKRFIRIIDLTEPSVPWRFIADPGPIHHVALNDLFMVRYGSPGLLGFGHSGVIANNLFRLIPKKKIVADFYFQYLSSRNADIADISGSSTMPAVNFSTLSQLTLVYPPIPEQRAIAAALSDVDELLSALDRLIAKKRALKQVSMQQLLTGQTRLPGYRPRKVSFRQTEVGVIPDDWKLTRLATLVDPSRGIRYGIVQPGRYDSQGRYMIRGQDYSEVNGWANPTDVFRVSPKIEERYRNSRVKTGDLIMTIVGYCGHVEMIPEWLNGANLTQTTARIAIHSDKAVNVFCKYMLLSSIVKNQVNTYMKGAAQPGLNCGDVEKFLIPIPSLPEQKAIAIILSDMDTELTALEQRRDKTRLLKQGMMQELLTGRIRLGSARGTDGDSEEKG